MKKIILVGIGSYSLQVAQWIRDMNDKNREKIVISGFLSQKHSFDNNVYDYPILGMIQEYKVKKDDIFACALCFPFEKHKYLEYLTRQNAKFINVIHPSVTIAESTQVGSGNVFFPNVTISANAYVGNFVTVLFSGMGHDTYAGNFVTIGSKCDITGGVRLDTGANIQTNAIIVPYKIIGAWANVCPGSIVIKNVKPGICVIGNPARKKKADTL